MNLSFASTDDHVATTDDRRGLPLRTVVVVLAAIAALSGVLFAVPASADDALPAVPVPGQPMTVTGGEYSYLATPQVTRRLDTMNMPRAVASLPLPKQYQPANLALAERFAYAISGTRSTKGSCLQIVIDPKPAGGGVFNYGFFAVAPAYCP